MQRYVSENCESCFASLAGKAKISVGFFHWFTELGMSWQSHLEHLIKGEMHSYKYMWRLKQIRARNKAHPCKSTEGSGWEWQSYRTQFWVRWGSWLDQTPALAESLSALKLPSCRAQQQKHFPLGLYISMKYPGVSYAWKNMLRNDSLGRHNGRSDWSV